MQPSQPDEGNRIPVRNTGGAKIPIVPRREAVGGDTEIDPTAIRLPKIDQEGVWDRELRIRPKEPKVPFGGVAKTASEPLSGADVSMRASRGHRRPFLSYFRSRRKGRHRIVNFIVLPVAVLASAAFVLWLLKFL